MSEGRDKYDAPLSEQRHETIWLQPWCNGCDRYNHGGDGRQWCQDNVFEDCPECGRKPVKYAIQEQGT